MAEENDDKGKGGADDKGKGGADDKSKGGADDKGKGGADDKGKGGDAAKTYTQAEFDAAVAEARQGARKSKTSKSKVQSPKSKEDGDDDESAELIEARKRADKLEADLRVRDARDAVETAAKTAGFANPAKIYRLVKDDLSFDDSGKADNVKDLIAIAKRDFPEELSQKGNGSADGGAGGRAGAGTSMNDIIRRAAGRL
jgi:hypothetical protein